MAKQLHMSLMKQLPVYEHADIRHLDKKKYGYHKERNGSFLRG